MRIPESRRGRIILAIGILVTAAAAFLLFRRFSPNLDPQHLLNEFANLLGAWTYLLVALLSFLETGAFVGLVVPGETALLVAGAIAGQGVINLYLLIAIAWLCAVLGDTTSFWLGHRLGRDFILKHGSRILITRERYEKVEEYFEDHGGKTVLVGRFIGLIRALSPFVAGSSGMKFPDFLPFSILGAGAQVSIHIVVGYLFARSLDAAAHWVGIGFLVFGSLVALTVGVVMARKWLRVPANRVRFRRRLESGRFTGPLLLRLTPLFEFLRDRLTPGGTFGLEATSLLAVLAVTSFTVIAFTEVTLDNPGPTPGDLRALDVVGFLRADWLDSVARAITDLGSTAVLLPLIVFTAALLLVSRRPLEATVLLFSAVTVFFGVDALKEYVQRPRPEGAIIAVPGYSFPSGHAAHSVFYLWLAITIAVRLRPDMVRKAAVVAVGAAVTVIVGLSRVYLEVHYLSDVTAGWALGGFCYALFATVTLLSVRLRNNPSP
ncbi:MAG: bifunctional DedA family/phosphatase PAP2 family protein [Solirubrobacterales bacterium]|nr:bifunctional DedA family/phosphatase PAP2 family protein [Solirubrobacterales bacterium]